MKSLKIVLLLMTSAVLIDVFEAASTEWKSKGQHLQGAIQKLWIIVRDDPDKKIASTCLKECSDPNWCGASVHLNGVLKEEWASDCLNKCKKALQDKADE